MPYTVVDKGSSYFNTKLYTGNGSATQAITGVNFQPDFVWIKDRVEVYDHHLFDAVRGGGNSLYSNDTVVENTYTTDISFNSDGFTTAGVGSAAINYINQNGHTFASWNWKANGAGVSNTQGTITSTVSANTTSGFSIVSYTGNGNASATFGHGLGATPKIVIIKNRQAAENWQVWFNNSTRLFLNLTNASVTTFPISTSSTLITLPSTSDGAWNNSSVTYIAYCFAEVKGFSKISSYTGNNTNDGPFVYTGFKPAFILIKPSNGAYNWTIIDNKRNPYNVTTLGLIPNTTSADTTGAGSTYNMDILSNGFKPRYSSIELNGSLTYIYMAFAENPFVSSKGIPTTAR